LRNARRIIVLGDKAYLWTPKTSSARQALSMRDDFEIFDA